MENKVKPNGKATVSANGKTVEMPVYAGTVGPDVIDIGKLYAQTGMFTLDPGFTSTASCESQITYIDGDAGILLHRGYPIDQLAEQSNFLEVCYLLLHGELPSAAENSDFVDIRGRFHEGRDLIARSAAGKQQAQEQWPAAAPRQGIDGHRLDLGAEPGALPAKARPPLIVDPVMVATSGARLLQPAAVKALVNTNAPVPEASSVPPPDRACQPGSGSASGSRVPCCRLRAGHGPSSRAGARTGG